ncbi:DNA alkylation repair protein [Sulfurospirillum arcachonense]|uniref:DNA alkylation repair protein n=1 Tax=Sulfurospirillum arcachonense TaxID=57666 RepID=UPI000469A9C9|nr:DNA alkylation repair protein [Sulfurospirillum arcachonense]
MAELFKDLYNKTYIELLCKELSLYVNEKEFTCKVFNESWSQLELKSRMRHISTILGEFLPKEYEKAIDILKSVFSKMPSSMGLENMIFQDFVEVHGLEYFEKSMEALEYFTKSSSSEFAVRRFIIKYPQKSMEQMQLWATSNDLHVRRLASEGCRPRLPWAVAIPQFKKNPQKVLEILDTLKDDESEYVRKSVANNLNDISKDNPELVKEITKEWLGQNEKRDKLLKHGCRTLLKKSDSKVLELFGFSRVKNITIDNFKITENVEKDRSLEFSFCICAQENLGKLRIEYAITFVRQNNKLSKKVFKISEGNCNSKRKQVSKKYSFRPISTRKYYRGKHKLEIIVNGEYILEEEFFYM